MWTEGVKGFHYVICGQEEQAWETITPERDLIQRLVISRISSPQDTSQWE